MTLNRSFQVVCQRVLSSPFSSLGMQQRLSSSMVHWATVVKSPSPRLLVVPFRSVKTTTTVHPEPVFVEEEKVLEKVLKERENSEDLPITLTNPYEKPVKKCILCTHGIEPNYKNTKLLYQFVSPYTGMVYGRHITGLCKKMQEKVETEVRVAGKMGFMSGYLKEVEFLKDPKLCDPERPVRAHKY